MTNCILGAWFEKIAKWGTSQRMRGVWASLQILILRVNCDDDAHRLDSGLPSTPTPPRTLPPLPHTPTLEEGQNQQGTREGE